MEKSEPIHRKILVIDRSFQYAFMLKYSLAVIAGVLLSFLVLSAWFYINYSRSDLGMKFFYVTGEAGSGIQQTTLLKLVIPALAVSAALSCIFTIVLGLFISHRIAGPIYNLKKALREVREGQLGREVKFRKGDEFHDLAEEVTKTIAWFRGKLLDR